MMRNIRPRFTVRTLAIFVTLVCAYFGAWESTKRYGIPSVRGQVESVFWRATDFDKIDALAPFIVRYETDDPFDDAPNDAIYLWLFGTTIRLLKYEATIPLFWTIHR